ncbi:MAG: hypothetical protein K940chlam8_00678 [Chlamydiae bacterium]|nr:hypothetical protein [Chlamydiota bacterium]
MRVKMCVCVFLGCLSVSAFSQEKELDLEERCLKEIEQSLSNEKFGPFDELQAKLEFAMVKAHKEKTLPNQTIKEIDCFINEAALIFSDLMCKKVIMECAFDLQKAQRTCMLIPDLGTRILGMLHLVLYFAKSNDLENAKKIYEEAYEIFPDLDYSDRVRLAKLQNALFVAQSCISYEDAFKSIEDLKDPRTKINMSTIVGFFLGTKDKKQARLFFEKARKDAEKLSSEIEKKTWRLIIAFNQSIYDREGAKEVFRRGLKELDTVDRNEELRFLGYLALLGASLNDSRVAKILKELTLLVDSISVKELQKKDILYSAIAVSEAFLGNAKKAVSFFNKIKQEEIKVESISVIVTKLSKQDFKKACDFISEIPDETLKARYLLMAVFRQYD